MYAVKQPRMCEEIFYHKYELCFNCTIFKRFMNIHSENLKVGREKNSNTWFPFLIQSVNCNIFQIATLKTSGR